VRRPQQPNRYGKRQAYGDGHGSDQLALGYPCCSYAAVSQDRTLGTLRHSSPAKEPDNRVVRYPGPEVPRRGTPPLRFTYEVTYVGGEEGERLKGELAEVTRDLLRHFATNRETDDLAGET